MTKNENQAEATEAAAVEAAAATARANERHTEATKAAQLTEQAYGRAPSDATWRAVLEAREQVERQCLEALAARATEYAATKAAEQERVAAQKQDLEADIALARAWPAERDELVASLVAAQRAVSLAAAKLCARTAEEEASHASIRERAAALGESAELPRCSDSDTRAHVVVAVWRAGLAAPGVIEFHPRDEDALAARVGDILGMAPVNGAIRRATAAQAIDWLLDGTFRDRLTAQVAGDNRDRQQERDARQAEERAPLRGAHLGRVIGGEERGGV